MQEETRKALMKMVCVHARVRVYVHLRSRFSWRRRKMCAEAGQIKKALHGIPSETAAEGADDLSNRVLARARTDGCALERNVLFILV